MTPEAIDDLADRLLAAITRGDAAAVGGIYADDAVIWHNFDQVSQTPAQNLVVLGWLHAKARNLRYEDVQRIVVEDGFVQQHVLRATAPDGSTVEVPAMLRVWCHDGRITRLDEYLDPAQAASLRS